MTKEPLTNCERSLNGTSPEEWRKLWMNDSARPHPNTSLQAPDFAKIAEHLWQKDQPNPHPVNPFAFRYGATLMAKQIWNDYVIPLYNKVGLQQFANIADLRVYMLHHPDKEMVRASCLHFLGDKYQDLDLTISELLKALEDSHEAMLRIYGALNSHVDGSQLKEFRADIKNVLDAISKRVVNP